MKKELSVIIPAYNEEERIGETLADISSFLSLAGYEYEIIVVNDGSRDRTASVVSRASASNARIRLISKTENQGKGRAVQEGAKHAVYATSLFMDADNSTSIREWDRFAKEFNAGAQAVIGTRHLPASKIVHPQPFLRRFLGSGYRLLCRFLFGIRVSDTNCGFKAYDTAVSKKIYSRLCMTDWTYDIEAICYLKNEHVEIHEVPVTWRHCEKASHLHPIHTACRTLASIFKLRGLVDR